MTAAWVDGGVARPNSSVVERDQGRKIVLGQSKYSPQHRLVHGAPPVGICANIAVRVDSGQATAEQDVRRSRQSPSEKLFRLWSGLLCSGLVWSGLLCSGLVWSGLVWSALLWSAGLVWSVVCSALVWSGLVWSGLEIYLIQVIGIISMEAVFLAAGCGSRMGSNKDNHKALRKMMGMPIIERGIQSFREAGVRCFTIVVGHAADLVEETIGDGSRLNVEVRYVYNKDWLLGNGTSLYAARKMVCGERFVLAMADHWFDPGYSTPTSRTSSTRRARFAVRRS